MVDPSYDDLLRSTDCPAWVWDDRGHFLAGNKALTDLLQESPKIGSFWPDLPDQPDQLAYLMSGPIEQSDHALCNRDLPWGTTDVHLRVVSRPGGANVVLATCTKPQSRIAMDHEDLLENMRTGVAAGDIALFSIDLASGLVDGNDAFNRLFEIPPGEVIDQSVLFERLHPGDTGEVPKQVRALFQGETPRVSVNRRIQRKDGEWRWVNFSAQRRSRAHQDRPPLICGCLTDITVSKRRESRFRQALDEARAASEAIAEAREETRKTAELFRVSVANGQMGPFSFCLETDAGWMMDETYRMLGYEPGAFRPDKRTCIRLIHPEDRARTFAQFGALVAGKIEFYDNEVRQRHADGSYHWYRTICRPVDRTAEGLPPLYAGVMTRIDGLKSNQSKLAAALLEAEETNERLNRLADGAPTALYELCTHPDGHTEMPFFSAKMPLLFDVSADDLRSDPEAIFRNMNPQDATRLRKAIHKTRHDVIPFEITVELDHSTRGQTWLQIASNPHEQRDGLVHSFASVTDISQQVDAERQIAIAATKAQLAHDRLTLMAENAPTALFEFHIAPDGAVALPYFNPQLADLFGVPIDVIRSDGPAIFKNIHPDDYRLMEEAIEVSRKDLSTFELQFRILHPTRGTVHAITRSVPTEDPDGGTRWYGSSFDLTDRLELERRTNEAAEKLQQAHDRLGALADAAPVGIFETTSRSDGSYEYTYTSARFNEIAGIAEDSPDSKRTQVYRNVHPDDFVGLDQARQAALEQEGIHQHRFRLIHPTAGERWIAASVVPSKRGDTTVLSGAYVDVTADMRREEDLRKAHDLAEHMRAQNEHQALHDPLTDLPNRRYFERELVRRFEIAQGTETAQDIVLIRIDCDRFKYINDTFGHEAGDAVLQHVAKVLQKHTRMECFPARIGGDEFTILPRPGATVQGASKLVEAIRNSLSEPLEFNGRHCRIQASFGIASVDATEETGLDLLAYADAALYQAKEAGRNRLELFTPDLRAAINETRRIAAELQDALSRDEFEPFYQVQIDTQKGCLSGVEALLRWRHPERGVLAPGAFMNVAEQLRIVPDLDRIVIQKARRDLATLRKRGIEVPKISLNVSAGRMRDSDVVSTAQELLADGVRVTFELLESTLVEEADDVFKFNLDRLRDLGIEIEIDDFGSGHASIVALMAIEPSVLKIDRRLLIDVADSERDQKLVRAIVEIAETLNIGIIAEGVETLQQVEKLRELGCDVVQGYYFSRPVDLATFETLLRNPPWAAIGRSNVA